MAVSDIGAKGDLEGTLGGLIALIYVSIFVPGLYYFYSFS